MRRAASRATGFTMIELVVVLALLGIVGAAIGSTMVRQQRFYRGASELIYARESVRDALEVVSSDIRGLATADTVRLLADSAMEFFAGIGTSVVCQVIGANEIGLPGVGPLRGNTITSLSTEPDTGDLALFFRSGADTAPDVWERHRISGFVSRPVAASCGDTSGIASGAGGRGFVVSLSSPLTGVGRGAPVRFVRRGRYSLYHASDGEWYLGYRRCNAVGASTCGGIQPLSGPYRGYSADLRRTGLLFEYFDAAGARLGVGSSPLSLARVDVTARAESRQQVPVERGFSRPADSASVSVAVRNRGR